MFDADLFQSLIARVRSGDQQAAADLVRNYEPLIRREVRLRLEDQRLNRIFDSLDVCQSVLASFFLRAAVGEYDLQDPQQLIRLLVTMTKNKVASAARRENRQKRDQRRTAAAETPEMAGLVGTEATPSVIAAGNELLRNAKELLSIEEERIAELRGAERSWEEIARELGGTAQARRVQFSRALTRISRQLGLDSAEE